MMPEVETFDVDGAPIAFIVRGGDLPQETTFVTPHDASLQVGFVVKSPDADVPRHDHYPIERHIVGTSEVLVVLAGRGEVELYRPDRTHLATRTLAKGDVIILLDGGHGFRFSEQTVLLEVKQGPYPGIDEKERF